MNWKGLLGGVAVGVGTTLKDRADAAQKERLQELVFAKQQLLKREDNTFQSQEAEKSRTFTAGQDEVKSSRTFENQSALMRLENEYDAPTREADIAAKRANTTESLARAKYYGEGGGGAGGKLTAAERKADALVANELVSNPNLTKEQQADIRIRAIRGELNEKDDVKAINEIYTNLVKEGARLPDGRRVAEATPAEGVAHAKSIYTLIAGQSYRGSTPSPVLTTTTAAPERQLECVRGPDGKVVCK